MPDILIACQWAAAMAEAQTGAWFYEPYPTKDGPDYAMIFRYRQNLYELDLYLDGNLPDNHTQDDLVEWLYDLFITNIEILREGR